MVQRPLRLLPCGGTPRHYAGDRVHEILRRQGGAHVVFVEAVREINADYARHSRAAFEVAKEVFEAEKVLANLLERAGV